VERWGQNKKSEERGVHLLGTEAKFCYKNDKISRPKVYFNHKNTAKFAETEKKNLKVEKLNQKLIVINLSEGWIGQMKWCLLPMLQKTCEMNQGVCIYLSYRWLH
jgi:hypothetical protein